MTEFEWPTPYGQTTFCDDIRHELEGKFSLIGIYSGIMILPVPFPVTIPKLGFSIKYSEAPGENVIPLKLMMYFPGDDDDKPSVLTDLHYNNQIQSAAADVSGELQENGRMSAMFNLVMSPVIISREGFIKVRAKRGEDIVKLGSLLVKSSFKAAENVQTPA